MVVGDFQIIFAYFLQLLKVPVSPVLAFVLVYQSLYDQRFLCARY